MSYSDALSKVIQKFGGVKKVLEYKDAWVFFTAGEMDSSHAIIKGTGEMTSYSGFLMRFKPTDSPKKVR